MRSWFLLFACLCCIRMGYAQCYSLVWSDEFDGAMLDQNKWRYEVGNGYPDYWGWGNSEEQYYTNHTDNVEVSNGTLKITARKENMSGFDYTSGRIRTKGLFDFKYGRVQARIKMSKGNGLWPAFWMMPSYNAHGGWPLSGEIDIMENFGSEGNQTFHTVHYQDYAGGHRFNSDYLPTVIDQWQEYELVWGEDNVWMAVNWSHANLQTPSTISGNWPFNEHFYMILCLGLGGSAGTINTSFPKVMEVDYVRVYQLIDDMEMNGPEQVMAHTANNCYTVPPKATSYDWSVPSDAEILSGQGTARIEVQWGESAGEVSCAATGFIGDVSGATTTCGDKLFAIQVSVITAEACELVLEDFEFKHLIHQSDVVGNTGTLTEKFTNPLKDAVNNSNLCGRFGRVGNNQYDALVYDLDHTFNVAGLIDGSATLTMDVLTNDITLPVDITFALINKDRDIGFPKGYHSQYKGTITANGQWQRVSFSLIDRYDYQLTHDQVDGIRILFNPTTNTEGIYYFDNIRISGLGEQTILGQSSLTTDGSQQYDFSYPYGLTHLWHVSDQVEVISGQNEHALTVRFSGGPGSRKDTVELIALNAAGCMDTLTKVVHVTPTSIADPNGFAGLSVFPVPAGEHVQVMAELGRDAAIEIDVYDLLGNQVGRLRPGKRPAGSHLFTLRCDELRLTNGLYYLVIRVDQEQEVRKILFTKDSAPTDN